MENKMHEAGKSTEEDAYKLIGEEDSATHHDLPDQVYTHNVPKTQLMSRQMIAVTAIVTPPENPPSSYLALSWCSLLCCLPLAICAVMSSKESVSSSRRGDYDSARKQGKRALALALASIVIGIIATALWIFFKLNRKTE